MGAANRVIAFVVMGLVSVVVIGLPITVIIETAAPAASRPWMETAAYLAVAALAALIAAFAPTGRRAWGFLFLLDSLVCFAMPAFDFLYTKESTQNSAEPLLSGAVGLLVGGFLGIVGFFVGVIFIGVALVLLIGSPGRASAPVGDA